MALIFMQNSGILLLHQRMHTLGITQDGKRPQSMFPIIVFVDEQEMKSIAQSSTIRL